MFGVPTLPAPGWLAPHGAPTSADDLVRHVLLSLRIGAQAAPASMGVALFTPERRGSPVIRALLDRASAFAASRTPTRW